MKKFKKLFLVVSIVAVLMLMMVVSVSAEVGNSAVKVEKDVSLADLKDVYELEYENILLLQPRDLNTPINDCKIIAYSFHLGELINGMVFTSECDKMVNYLFENWSSVSGGLSLTPENLFKQFSYYTSYFDTIYDESGEKIIDCVPLLNEFGLLYYCGLDSINLDESFSYHMANHFCCSEEDLYYGYVNESPDTFTTLNTGVRFKDLFIQNYSSLADTKTITSLEGQVSELNTTITQKEAAIIEKDTTISTLEGEKTALESNAAGLNMQVADLVQDKAQLNASIKSLEKQLQIKVDKAYAEGLTDADNKISVMPIIIAVAFMLEIIALVVFIVAKLRKNKSRKY